MDEKKHRDSSVDLILVIYVHGFKGTDVTFEKFPERIEHLVQATTPNVRVKTAVFPVYETKGELSVATERFVDWLTTLTVEEEVNHGEGGGAGKAKIVLCGHSMGGLLLADAIISIKAHAADPGAPLWPRVVALIAFDTPYLGLNPHVFKNSISKYAEHVETAKTIASGLGALSPFAMGLFGASRDGEQPSAGTSRSAPSSGRKTPREENGKPKETERAAPAKSSWLSSRSMLAASAVSAFAAVAGTAYYKRGDIVSGWQWVLDHGVWLKNLWDTEGMRARLSGVVALGPVEDMEEDEVVEVLGGGEKLKPKGDRVLFRNFYTLIPSTPPKYPTDRSFCVLPASHHALYPFWTPSISSFAEDEVSAHIGMFNAKTNEGFYDMGLQVSNCIAEAVMNARRWDNDEHAVKGFTETRDELGRTVLVEEGLI